MAFLGLDLGGKCGYALLDVDGSRITSGVWNLGKRSPESLHKFKDSLSFLVATHVPIVLCYEKVNMYHLGKQAAHAYGGYESIAWVIAVEFRIEILTVTVQRLKKLATGFSNAEKDEVGAAALQKWNHVTLDDNEADALYAAEYGRLQTLG